MNGRVRLLHVDADHVSRARRGRHLHGPDREVLDADDARELPLLIRQHRPALAIVDAPPEDVPWTAINRSADDTVSGALLVYIHDDPDARAEALTCGADASLAPTAPPRELRAVVDALLRLRHEQVAAEDRVHDTVTRENARLFREAQTATETKDEFIATLSHELRNPLAAIRYALPVIERESLADPAEHAVAVIDRQVTHLSQMVDDLLDVSRTMRGTVPLRRERVDLRGILAAAAEAASSAIVRGHHHLALALPDQPLWLNADPVRVSQVVTHLLNNAATFTPRGGEIALEAAREDGEVAIHVRDNGSGIPPESLTEIFDLFRQLHRSDTLQGGLGIGLALSRRLVELHGGSIEARSEGVGHGAEFVVRLPVPPGDADPDRAAPPREHASPERQLRVLIVDDNVDLVDMLADLVSGQGHVVDKAFDGATAVERALAFRPDVVLLDLGLPLISGIDVARRLRSRPETASTKLVAFTGWGQAEDRTRTHAAGFDYHLTKPADLETVTAVLTQVAAQ